MKWFELEKIISDRLRAELARVGLEHVHVLTRADLACETSHPVPAIAVVYRGYAITSVRPALLVSQTWLTIPIVRSVADLASGQDARDDIDELIRVCLAGVWGPVQGHGPVLPAQGKAPGAVYQDGLYYHPIAWECTGSSYEHTKGSPNG